MLTVVYKFRSNSIYTNTDSIRNVKALMINEFLKLVVVPDTRIFKLVSFYSFMEIVLKVNLIFESYIYIYIYIVGAWWYCRGCKCPPIHWADKVELATVVKGDSKAPFSIATTMMVKGGCYSFPLIAPLDPWSLPYNAVLSNAASMTIF